MSENQKTSNFKEVLMSKPIPAWGIVAVFIVGIALGLGGYFLFLQPAKDTSSSITAIVPPAEVAIQTPPGDVSVADLAPVEAQKATDTLPLIDEADRDYFKNFEESFLVEPDFDKHMLEVEWTKPVRLGEDGVRNLLRPSVFAATADTNASTEAKIAVSEDMIDVSTVWETGIVHGGRFNDARVYLWKVQVPIYDMGDPGPIYYRLIQPMKGDLLLLTVYPSGDYWFTAYSKYIKPAHDIYIKDLDNVPTSLILDNGKRLTLSSNGRTAYNESFLQEYPIEDFIVSKIAKTMDGQDVYRKSSTQDSYEYGCVYVYGPDGAPHAYSSVITTASAGYPDGTPKVEWYDGMPADRFDPYRLNGCGGHDCTDIVDADDLLMSDLKVGGRTTDGEPVYILKNPLTNDEFKEVYDYWYVPENKPSIEEFAKKYPNAIFFWKDAFDRWVRYSNKDLQPLTECGKPVIYLYPEQDTNVSVRLPSFIDVTVSEPEYPKNGWTVLAHPDGQLEYSDGNTYGSLYWEGLGVGYQTPKTGFVVKDGEQEAFLNEILAKYGLNQTESREFIEFWLPHMQGASYYRVSFLVEDWNKAAPLYVSPKPDSVIRIFMDWQKLSAPISIEQPEIITPKRQGFTLVEWGGLLY